MILNLRSSLLFIFSVFLIALYGCSEQAAEPASQAASSPTAPAAPAAPPPAAGPDRVVIQSIAADVNQGIYKAALADPRRPMEEASRDAGRKPIQVLKFFGVAPGHRVLDIASGDGYYTRILSGIVGSTGSVIANNSGRRASEESQALYREQYSSYHNVELNFEAPEEISLPDNSVDVVLLSLAIHHWHYDDATGEFTPQFALPRYENIYRMLKPGGIFAVIDHAAAPEASRQLSDELHRIPGTAVIEDVTLAGFVLEGESSIHANYPNDDVNVRWGRGPRDATNRIVMKFRKP